MKLSLPVGEPWLKDIIFEYTGINPDTKTHVIEYFCTPSAPRNVRFKASQCETVRRLKHRNAEKQAAKVKRQRRGRKRRHNIPKEDVPDKDNVTINETLAHEAEAGEVVINSEAVGPTQLTLFDDIRITNEIFEECNIANWIDPMPEL